MAKWPQRQNAPLFGGAFQVVAQARAYLTERGVNLGGEEQPKTRTALEFVSKRLEAAAG